MEARSVLHHLGFRGRTLRVDEYRVLRGGIAECGQIAAFQAVKPGTLVHYNPIAKRVR